MHPPDPEMRRAALQDSPNRKTDFNIQPDCNTENLVDRQAVLVSRLYAVSFAAAETIARLAFAVSR
jgi:hypothetical protein